MKGKKRLHLGRVVYELDEMTGITGEFFFFFFLRLLYDFTK